MNTKDIKPFSKVRVTTTEEVFEGLFLPQESQTVVLKLDSGYNIGILPDSIKDIDVLEEPQHSAPQVQPSLSINADLQKVRILHTGGTIASKVDYETGGVVGKFKPEELLALFPELQTIAQVDAQFLGNMSSDDYRFVHFNKVAQAVYEGRKEGITRFVVTGGTDFLHYMSAALSFLLKDVPAGVIVVGSQRSSDRGSSDAFTNLTCATQFLAHSNYKGVGVCMHEGSSDSTYAILKGTNVRKMHSSARGAFKPINTTKLATVNYPELTMDLHQTIPICQEDDEVPTQLTLLDESLKIGIVYSKPNMFAQELQPYFHYNGLILAGSGFGHFPLTPIDEHSMEHTTIAKTLKELAEKIPVAATTQAIYGRVNLQVYSPGRKLLSYGILGQQSSMTVETSYMKLAYLLSVYPDKVKELYDKDLIGEFPKTDIGDFL